MENDVLSRLTMNEGTRTLAKRLFGIALILLILDGIYCAANLIEWYLILGKAWSTHVTSQFYFFNYILRPILILIQIVISLIAYIMNYKAYGSINTAFKNQEPILVNKGFKNIFTVFLLTAISFIIEISSTVYQIILIKGSKG